jgi:hypothetical protein
MNRTVLQVGAALAVFILLGAISIFLTNALFRVTAADRPAVTFQVASDQPAVPNPTTSAQ